MVLHRPVELARLIGKFIAQLVITGQSAFRGLFALKMGIGDFAQIEICNEDYFLFADDRAP